jgi:putative membrane protein
MEDQHGHGVSSLNDDKHSANKTNSWLGLVIRFVVASIVLMVTSFLTPGFSKIGFGTALFAALIISLLDWIIVKLFKFSASPFGRGITGFLVSALILYMTQFVVPGMSISLLGAAIAAFIIGIIDAAIPIRVF